MILLMTKFKVAVSGPVGKGFLFFLRNYYFGYQVTFHLLQIMANAVIIIFINFQNVQELFAYN